MAKKKKRQLQPHEKVFVNSVITGLCIALFLAVLGWPWEITYEQAQVTVDHCYTSSGYSRHTGGRKSLRIISTDNRKLTVSDAEIPLVELGELLVPGTQVDVEYGHDWFTRLIPPEGGFVTKLTLGDQVLVQNIPGDHTGVPNLAWLGLPFPVFGFLCWADGEHLLRKWKKKREKERKRRKKEGNIK